MSKVLIVDDEKAARFAMKKVLRKESCKLLEAENGEVALSSVEQEDIDVVLLDLNMPKMDGFTFLEKLTQQENTPLVIVVTAHGSEKLAVEAIKNGAYDYLAKPYDVEELRTTVRNAIEKRKLRRENKELLEKIRLQESFGEIVGESKTMQDVYSVIDKVAKTDVTVLICGENGTGKELVAQEIHRRSNRSDKPFIAINCAALPENLIESELFGHEKGTFTGADRDRKGKLEEAHGGTLFLDEIGDMAQETQAKVLRVLQDFSFQRLGSNQSIKVDVRFLAATNKDLKREIESGNFREDLYYRVKVVDVQLPALRERVTDIPCLISHFVQLFSQKYNRRVLGLQPSALQSMVQYRWPGNVRQLKNIIEKSIVLSTEEYIALEDLPKEIFELNNILSETSETNLKELENQLIFQDTISFREAKKSYVREFEKKFICARLKKHAGNISQTAQSLDMPRQSLQQKVRELGIKVREIL